MALKKIQTCPGRQQEAIAKLTEDERQRSATRSTGYFGENVMIQVWPHRKAMAKSIRMQQSGPPRSGNWSAIVKLTDGEGF